jgi:hypothetical protein
MAAFCETPSLSNSKAILASDAAAADWHSQVVYENPEISTPIHFRICQELHIQDADAWDLFFS